MTLRTFPLTRLALAALVASGTALAQTPATPDTASTPSAARTGASRTPAADASGADTARPAPDRAAADAPRPPAPERAAADTPRPPAPERAAADTPRPPAPDRMATDAPRPPPRDRPAADTTPTTTLTGRVARWLPNPNGEVDGFLLDDGTQVQFPPHLSSRMLTAVELQDSVLVTGRAAPASQGPKVVRATQIRSSASGQTVGDEAPAGGPPPAPRDHAALTAMKEGGRISALLRTGRGDVNGVVLDSGTVVRFPPHAGAQFASLLKPTGTLYAEGYGTSSARGSAFEATQIGASASALQTVFPGPRGMAGPGARPPAPGGERGRSATDGPRPALRDGAAPPPPRDGAMPPPPPRDGVMPAPRDAAMPAPRDAAMPPPPRDGAMPPPPRDGAMPPPRDAASASR